MLFGFAILCGHFARFTVSLLSYRKVRQGSAKSAKEECQLSKTALVAAPSVSRSILRVCDIVAVKRKIVHLSIPAPLVRLVSRRANSVGDSPWSPDSSD
jgi:hypothetical protein